MLRQLFGAKPSRDLGEHLYAEAVEQARSPVFYTSLGVSDRIDARFELYIVHVLLVIMRLRDEGDEGAEIAQRLFDVFVSALDNTLRELGVGDTSMAKKMRKLGESMYGRMTAYEPTIRAADHEGLREALVRNVYEGEAPDGGLALATYIMDTRSALATQPFADLIRTIRWIKIPS
ncbi:ubiquinol-cytochrome C chaperone family protein [Brevundimonas variabilis]|uniref:Cytochrome b pre-mRNA-processing protein 3 n=1 Tax=Brevundimonas variabilis TaxID=74312 RepID=A0A7W9CH18_9CAUL|nr:ubiquinol-cytochrome C chaperone family protein [Brevundimonas variabilis]MBB5745509.1 cytochrome b pre-mRNA-processing protein 3 [Brevundimonas variabilis]